jgi:hypothetical protein
VAVRVKPAVILVIPGVLLFLPSAYAANVERYPPSDAKGVQCVGTATRKLCIGESEEKMYRVMGKGHEVGSWTDEARGESIRVFEVNRGTAGCWIRLLQSTARITSIHCAEIEK